MGVLEDDNDRFGFRFAVRFGRMAGQTATLGTNAFLVGSRSSEVVKDLHLGIRT